MFPKLGIGLSTTPLKKHNPVPMLSGLKACAEGTWVLLCGLGQQELRLLEPLYSWSSQGLNATFPLPHVIRIDTPGSQGDLNSGSLPRDESHPIGEGQVETSETNLTLGAGYGVHPSSTFTHSPALQKPRTLA